MLCLVSDIVFSRCPSIVSYLSNIDLAVHEPIIWRLHEMLKGLGCIHDATQNPSNATVSTLTHPPMHCQCQDGHLDVVMDIRLLHICGMCLNVSTLMEPISRPRTITSQAVALGLEFANVEDVEVRPVTFNFSVASHQVPLRGYERQNIREPASQIWHGLDTHLRDQIWRALFNLLEFYFSIGGVSQVITSIYTTSS